MARPLRLALLAVLTATLLNVAASPAAAARSVPFGFFGTVLNPEITTVGAVDNFALDAQAGLMARSGVESLRATFPWPALEPSQGRYDWTYSDRIVGAAANHRIQVLANVIGTPLWASSRPRSEYPSRYAPRDAAVFGRFMRELVRRYGPRGSFWVQNPQLPKVPVRWWQIWNEQMGKVFWATRPWGPSYTRLLRAAYPAIKREDRRAKVVAGSLVTFGSYSQWAGARDLYRAGARRYFDVIAIHPFTDATLPVRVSVERIIEIVRRVRREMSRRGDGRKPVILTEVTWPAALGRVPRRRLLGLETTSRGQVQRLKAGFARIARERRRLRIQQAYWFTWASPYDADSPASDVAYRFSGLVRFANGRFTPARALRAYTTTARRYQGCAKSDNARRCR